MNEITTSKDELLTYLNECKKTYEFNKKNTIDWMVDKFGITETSADFIKIMSDDSIEEVSYENIAYLFNMLEIDESLFKQKRNKSSYLDLKYIDYVKYVFTQVKTKMKELDKDLESLNELTEHMDDIKKEYIDYVHTEEFMDKKQKRLEKMKNEADLLPDDDPKKKDILKKLDIMSKLNSMYFLYERIESYGQKEIDSIMKSFFDTSASNLVMNKFKSTCKKIGVNHQIIQYFFNFEDRYLPAEYAPFNNFFLFVCVRFIAYSDVSNEDEKFYVNKIFGTLTRFIDHNLYGDEESMLIDLIKKIDGYFNPYIDKFKEKNTTYREHPVRVAHMEQVEELRRQKLLKKLRLAGVEVVDSLDSISLQNILNDHEKKVKYREELEEKCHKYGIKFNKGEALANLEVFVNAYEEEHREKDNSDQIIDVEYRDEDSEMDENDDRVDSEKIVEIDTTAVDDVKESNTGRGLTRPIMIVADTEEEKEFRKQHGIVEPSDDEPEVIDVDVSELGLDYEIMENNQTGEPEKGYKMITPVKSTPKEETIDIDELEKLVAGPLE